MNSMADELPKSNETEKATILLVSGELDKAILAFEIAAGMAAMGTEVSMWFVLYGVNCLKNQRVFFRLKSGFPKKLKRVTGEIQIPMSSHKILFVFLITMEQIRYLFHSSTILVWAHLFSIEF